MKMKQMKKWILLNIGMILMLGMVGCGKKQDEVVVYTAVDSAAGGSGSETHSRQSGRVQIGERDGKTSEKGGKR